MLVFGVLAALAANLFGGVLVFGRLWNVPVLAWVAYGAVACGQVGLDLRLHGPEPWAGIKFMLVNALVGLVIALGVKTFYASLDR